MKTGIYLALREDQSFHTIIIKKQKGDFTYLAAVGYAAGGVYEEFFGKLKCEEVGDAPRAIVLVENREKALETYNAFLKYIRFTTTRVYFADEKLHVDLLKSEIFDGVDVLIATPQTLRKLSSLNGVNTTQLKIFNIDDAEFLIENSAYTGIMSITQSITKCQFVLYSDKMIPTLKRFESYFMKHSKKIAL